MMWLFAKYGYCLSDLFYAVTVFGRSCASMLHRIRGWSGGAKVLDKLPVPGRPTSLNDSRARPYCAYSRCERGLFGHFFSRLSFYAPVMKWRNGI